MTDRDALLAAVIANPDEDMPRLMFADWLQENGQPQRGEFVRLQVEGAHAEPFSPQAREYAAAAQRLLNRHLQAWTEHIANYNVGLQFVRGFVEHVNVNAATFARDAAALFAREPVRSVQIVRFVFTTNPVTLDPLFNSPQLTRIARLDFSKLRNHADYFDQLASCPRLTGLTDLCLRDTPVPVPWLRALLAGPALPALRGLDLADDTNLSRVLAEALPTANHRKFARLDLSYIKFRSDDIQKALSAKCVRGVEELRLGWLPATGPGPLTHLDLGFALPLDRLRVLDLHGQGVGDEGVRELVTELGRRRDPAPLRWLGLANNRLAADAVAALVRADESRVKLYHLDLRDNGMTPRLKAAVQDRFPEAEVLI